MLRRITVVSVIYVNAYNSGFIFQLIAVIRFKAHHLLLERHKATASCIIVSEISGMKITSDPSTYFQRRFDYFSRYIVSTCFRSFCMATTTCARVNVSQSTHIMAGTYVTMRTITSTFDFHQSFQYGLHFFLICAVCRRHLVNLTLKLNVFALYNYWYNYSLG